MKVTISFLLFIFIFILCPVNAQVTIGSGEEPENGALLDLKEYVPKIYYFAVVMTTITDFTRGYSACISRQAFGKKAPCPVVFMPENLELTFILLRERERERERERRERERRTA
jgi:hypothetical protein